MTEQIQDILAGVRKRLEARYHDRLLHLVLYGSHARQEADAGSDIDVLVVLAGPVDVAEEISRTAGDIADVSLQFDEVVSCAFISEDDYRNDGGPLMRNIRREGVPA